MSFSRELRRQKLKDDAIYNIVCLCLSMCKNKATITHQLVEYSHLRHTIISDLLVVAWKLLLLCLFSVMLHFLLEDITDFPTLPRFHVRVEDNVDFFERLSRSFGIHEKYLKHHCSAKNTKYDVGLPLNVGERRGHKVRKREVKNPIRGCRDPDSLGTVFEGKHLGAIDPCGGGLVWFFILADRSEFPFTKS